MDVNATLEAPCAADRLFTLVDDLALYPAWMDMAHRVLPESAAADVWQVELRARVGPFARSKQLRMCRTVHDPASHRVVFERSEIDGRMHSPWVLSVDVVEHGPASTLHMHLHYGGGLWTGGVLERVLGDQITNGRERLVELVRSTR